MPNCRSIPPAVWDHVREALVFYFSRRHGVTNAEDLAHETIKAVLTREDYFFASEDEFLRVCYGFAARISQSGYRVAGKRASDVSTTEFVAPQGHRVWLNQPEMAILLEEVIRAGESQLSSADWQLIQSAADVDRATIAKDLNIGDANNVRVRLFRARNKLAKLTGWNREPAARNSRVKKNDV
jgi:DNA-directed RNA polymerase specialized sigma24 family protein